jgi:hypothetical protein
MIRDVAHRLIMRAAPAPLNRRLKATHTRVRTWTDVAWPFFCAIIHTWVPPPPRTLFSSQSSYLQRAKDPVGLSIFRPSHPGFALNTAGELVATLLHLIAITLRLYYQVTVFTKVELHCSSFSALCRVIARMSCEFFRVSLRQCRGSK